MKKSFLQRRLEQEEEHYYKNGDLFTYALPPESLFGLAMIQQYEGLDEEKITHTAQSVVYTYLCSYGNPVDTIENIITNKLFFYNTFESNHRLIDSHKQEMKIIDSQFYNEMRNEFDYTPDMCMNFFFDFLSNLL